VLAGCRWLRRFAPVTQSVNESNGRGWNFTGGGYRDRAIQRLPDQTRALFMN
jgi:hypothetical protein